MVIYYYARRATIARETEATMASVPTFAQQIDAFEKGADAARKDAVWLAHLTNTQESLVDKSDEAVEALKRHAAAVTELDDATKEAALSQIDLDESTGKITAIQAIEQRAKIERADIIKKAADKQKLLDDIAAQRSADSIAAKKAEDESQAAYKAALDKTPFGKLNDTQKRRVSDLIAMEENNANPDLINRILVSLSPEEKIAYESQLRIAKLAAIEKEEEALKAKLGNRN